VVIIYCFNCGLVKFLKKSEQYPYYLIFSKILDLPIEVVFGITLCFAVLVFIVVLPVLNLIAGFIILFASVATYTPRQIIEIIKR
jgi:hypothetical protein